MRLKRSFAAGTAILALTMLVVGALAQSQPKAADKADMETAIREYLAAHPEDIQRIVKDYLIKNTDILQEQINELRKKANAAKNPDKSQVIKENEALLFNSPRQVVLGNPKGDVTLVEFFDYNCGYCKRAVSDMQELLKDDPELKFVLREYPILSEGSTEAARVAVAVRMQDPSGKKYLDFHLKLMGTRGQANQETAMAAAEAVGLDMARIKKDMTSQEVEDTLQESVKLAGVLGVGGTPGYVVGDGYAAGAIGIERLKEKIQSVRSRKPS